MSMDDVIQIITPAPDSHFLLLPCPACQGDNVAYVQKCTNDEELWHGKCFDCGYTGEGGAARHDAQLIWNKKSKEVHYENTFELPRCKMGDG